MSKMTENIYPESSEYANQMQATGYKIKKDPNSETMVQKENIFSPTGAGMIYPKGGN